MIKICIADNNPVVYHGIKSYLMDSADFDVVGYATSLKELQVLLLDNKNIHFVILDIELYGISSIRDVKTLVLDYPSTKFFIFSNVSEMLYANNALKVGVRGYLEKNVSMKDFGTAIKSVSLGNTYTSDDVKKLNQKESKNSERLHKKLSAREIEVLKYLANGKKNKEIAKILKLDEKTISTYKLRLLHKLNVTNLIDLINKAKNFQLV
jgi:DNA-binding NarL/FixJ family response regulator